MPTELMLNTSVAIEIACDKADFLILRQSFDKGFRIRLKYDGFVRIDRMVTRVQSLTFLRIGTGRLADDREDA